LGGAVVLLEHADLHPITHRLAAVAQALATATSTQVGALGSGDRHRPTRRGLGYEQPGRHAALALDLAV
jgi:hypothetical protein